MSVTVKKIGHECDCDLQYAMRYVVCTVLTLLSLVQPEEPLPTGRSIWRRTRQWTSQTHDPRGRADTLSGRQSQAATRLLLRPATRCDNSFSVLSHAYTSWGPLTTSD